jgi:hypothetical protein
MSSLNNAMFPVLVSASETGLLIEEATEEVCDETGTDVGTADEALEATDPLLVPLLVIPSMLAGAEESGCKDEMSDAMPDPMSEESDVISSEEEICSDPVADSALLVICESMLMSSSPGFLQAAVMPTAIDSITIAASRKTIFQFLF